MSLCLHAFKGLEPKSYREMKELFDEFKVDYAKMNEAPLSIIQDPNLVVQIEHNFYTWEAAAPIIMSYLAFKQPLRLDSTSGLVSLNEQMLGETANVDRLFDMDDEDFEDMKGDQNDEFYFEYLNDEEAGPGGGEELGIVREGNEGGDEDLVTIKTLVPTHEQLESLNLKAGANAITFQVNSRLQGCQKISGKIFLWDYRTKIVISDVDGTITRSDVMGHVMPRLGNDWSHTGIADFFTKISANGI